MVTDIRDVIALLFNVLSMPMPRMKKRETHLIASLACGKVTTMQIFAAHLIIGALYENEYIKVNGEWRVGSLELKVG